MPHVIKNTEARSILSQTSGFIAQAGFTHSLSPARNCTYGCSYCYVPTMRIYAGLHREDWEHWGEGTTFKRNAPDLIRRTMRGSEIIYCSPLVDPWQPAEQIDPLMPSVLDALIEAPPQRIVFQTRAPLILRDLERLQRLGTRTDVRVSFSVTTDRDDIRRIYEPLCEPNDLRLDAVRRLTVGSIRTFITLAPLLPCTPEVLGLQALDASKEDLIADPFHTRSNRQTGATTRSAAFRIASHHGHLSYFDATWQSTIVEQLAAVTQAHGRRFATGTEGFSWLSQK
ncbi:MAG: hypothetical protein H7039_24740 [Bryobacteraceae bacterium]|nr:hypothetical protein [Bryobacteraceae bacterium]